MSKLPFLLNEIELSRWAYEYCRDVENNPEIRKHITNSYWMYYYCKYVRNYKE